MTTQTNIVPEILSLKDVELYFNLSANTIKRERWEQKQVRQNKLKLEEVKNLDGFGYTTEPIFMYGKLYYRKQDVLNFIESRTELSPEQRVDG